MRARLDRMNPGEAFHFLCSEKMAEKMDRVVALGRGEIIEKDIRSYGVVISVRKEF